MSDLEVSIRASERKEGLRLALKIVENMILETMAISPQSVEPIDRIAKKLRNLLNA